MPDLETQRAVLASEFLWFGGQLGAPKVYDSGTSFHASPNLKGAEVEHVSVETAGEGERKASYIPIEDGWIVSVDPA